MQMEVLVQQGVRSACWNVRKAGDSGHLGSDGTPLGETVLSVKGQVTHHVMQHHIPEDQHHCQNLQTHDEVCHSRSLAPTYYVDDMQLSAMHPVVVHFSDSENVLCLSLSLLFCVAT
jgi:hypothetical protein